MRGKTVLIIGATSAIARSLAHQFAQQGAALHLAARDTAEVERIASDLTIRYGVPTSWSAVEATRYDTHPAFFQQVLERTGRLDGVVISLGELGDQSKAQIDFDHAQRIIHSNYTGVISLLTPIANFLEQQGHGFIVGIASVAGDRGRPSNYVYGSAKAALSTFLQGLRSRLAKAGVHVLTVKPGFVDTKMTFGKSGMFLVASPDQVAAQILRALNRGQNIAYVPWFWFGIMSIIRAIPEFIFKRLNL
ncbi:MAG: SDR family oxidoreductase [Synechococcales bacterium]|nr:SDR family oxidoreductase [Synechococcales bacterium]